MKNIPVEIAELICNNLDARENARLSVLCKHWHDMPREPIHQRLVIYSHMWHKIQKQNKIKCRHLVIINVSFCDKHTIFFDGVLEKINPMFVEKLVLYDIYCVDLEVLCAQFQELKYIKLYRVTKIKGYNGIENIDNTKVQILCVK